MFNVNDDMKVKIVENYYRENQAVWDSKNAILSTELFRERHPSGNYLAIEASNIAQLCFDLSSSYEIKSIEIIGAKFVTNENLVSPICSTRGNLVLTNYQQQGTWKEHEEYESKEYHLDHPVELTASVDNMLLHIGINTEPISQIVAASTNLFYALSKQALQGIWISNPLLG